MRESIAADHPFELQRDDAGRGARVHGRARPAVQGRDHRRPRRGRGARRHADPADDLLPAGPVHRPVPGPARRAHRQDRRRSSCSARPAPTGAATRSGRCSSASTAPPGRPRRSSTSTCGAARRRRSATTAGSASSSTCSASTTSAPGSAFWHPKGQRIWRTLERRDARAPGAARLPGGQHPDRRQRAAVAAVGPLGPLPRQHVPDRVGGPDVQPQADELPREHVHLPIAPALLPRPAAALQRVRPAASQRAIRAR